MVGAELFGRHVSRKKPRKVTFGDRKQTFQQSGLAGASRFLVGKDATSQLHTIFNQQLHLFLPCILTQALLFPPFSLSFPRPKRPFDSPKLRLLSALSIQSSITEIHTTTTRKQASRHFNQQSVTKDNRLEEQSPCRRHCLSTRCHRRCFDRGIRS